MNKKLALGESEASAYLNLVCLLLNDWPNYWLAQAIMKSASPNYDREEIIALFHIASRGGVGTDLLLSALDSDIAHLKTPTLFFREESASSLLVSYWMRTEENTYLSDILDYQISKLISLEKSLSQEEEELVFYAQKFLDSIFKSSPLLSPQTRHLISMVYKCLKRRFPDHSKVALQRHIVSAIFFVRFICPELSLSKAKEFASATPIGRRNLILIAKLLVTVSAANYLDSHSKLIAKLIEDNLDKLDRFCSSLMKGTKGQTARDSSVISERSEFDGLGFDPNDCTCLASYLERKIDQVKVSLSHLSTDPNYSTLIDEINAEIKFAKTSKSHSSFMRKFGKPLSLSTLPSSASPPSLLSPSRFRGGGAQRGGENVVPVKSLNSAGGPPSIATKNPFMHLLPSLSPNNNNNNSGNNSNNNSNNNDSDESISLASVRSTPVANYASQNDRRHHNNDDAWNRRRGTTSTQTQNKSGHENTHYRDRDHHHSHETNTKSHHLRHGGGGGGGGAGSNIAGHNNENHPGPSSNLHSKRPKSSRTGSRSHADPKSRRTEK